MPRVKQAWAAKAKQDDRAEDSEEEEEENARQLRAKRTNCKFEAASALLQEHRAAKARLERARLSGRQAEEFNATLALAELQLARGRYAEALRLANLAEGLSAEATTGDGAAAVRVAVKALLAEDKLNEALDLAEEEHQFNQLSGNKKAEAVLGMALAEVRIAAGRPREALKVLNASLAGFRALKEDHLAAATLKMLAAANLEVDGSLCSKRSLEAAEEALKLFRKQADRAEEGSCLLLLAKAHLARHELFDAYAFAHGALELARQRSNLKEEATALRELSAVFLARDDLEIALDAAQDSVEICQHLTDWLGEIASQQALNSAYQVDGMVNKGLECLEQALKLARAIKDRKRVIAVLELMTKIHHQDDGLRIMDGELTLARSCGDLRREMSAYRKIAQLNVSLGNNEEAMQVATDAAAVMRAAGDKHGEAAATQLIAEVFMAMRDYTEALKAVTLARTLFQQAKDVKGEVCALQMAVTMHEAKGNAKEALACCVDQRKVYKAAGWQEEEAMTLLAVADVLLAKRGPWEAMSAAKESVALYKEMKDKEGEANAMLVLGSFQVPSEAMRTVKSARQIFQSLGHASGEAQALEVVAKLHLHSGAVHEALEVSREAMEITQKAADKQGEAKSTEVLAMVHMELVRKEVDLDITPSDKVMQDALWVTMQSLALWEELADTIGQATALLQLSQLHRFNKADPEHGKLALNAAKAALDIAQKLDDMKVEGTCILALCESYMANDEGPQAVLIAEDAKNFFEQLGDDAGTVDAEALLEKAKYLVANPKKALEDGADDNAEAKAVPSGKTRFPIRQQAKPKPAPRTAPRTRGFSSIVESIEQYKQEEDAAELRRMELLNIVPDPYNAPNQELRKRQMAMSASAGATMATLEEEPKPKAKPRPKPKPADAAATSAADGEPQGPASRDGPESLRRVLAIARPDWNAKERALVQDKLTSIEIASAQQLFDVIRSEGTKGINARLKNAGFKGLLPATLEALKVEADKLESPENFY